MPSLAILMSVPKTSRLAAEPICNAPTTSGWLYRRARRAWNVNCGLLGLSECRRGREKRASDRERQDNAQIAHEVISLLSDGLDAAREPLHGVLARGIALMMPNAASARGAAVRVSVLTWCGGWNFLAQGHPFIPGLHAQPQPIIIHTQVAIAAAGHSLGHYGLDFLRHHANIRFVATIVAETIETEAVIEAASMTMSCLSRMSE